MQHLPGPRQCLRLGQLSPVPYPGDTALSRIKRKAAPVPVVLPRCDAVRLQAKHTCQYVGGFLASTEEDEGPGSSGGAVTLKAMVAGDVAECADLFLAAHGGDCGWDRRADIELTLGSDSPFSM